MPSGFRLFPEGASTLAGRVDAVMLFTIGVSIFFSVIIVAALLVFAVRFRRRSAAEKGAEIHGSALLEITWSVIPLAIVLFLFVWGFKVFYDASRIPSGAVEYWATGKQWMWKFQHPTGPREINELHVPANTPIRLTMTSEDVIHSFFVPAFRVKQDVIPGRYTTTWFEATKPGTYDLYCTEYCGAEHSKMIGRIVVQSMQDYQAWLAGARPGKVMAASGEDLFVAKSCNTCHRPDSSARAPILDGVFGKSVKLQDGRTVAADETYLRESILDPHAKIVEGFQPIMPTYQGQVSEEELIQLIAYVKNLGKPAGEAGSAATPAPPATVSAHADAAASR